MVVPLGSLQFENGMAESARNGLRIFDGPESLLRFGVLAKTELRLTAPDYSGEFTASSGFGDFSIGTKQQLGPILGGFDISLVLSLSLPTGARGVSSGGYDPSVQLPWSRELSPSWTVAGMLSAYWPTEDGRRNMTGETTFLFDRRISESWDVFIEYAGDFPERGGPRHLAHLGTAYKLTPHQQLDVHLGLGLSSGAVNHLIGIGYSFRFQSFRTRQTR
ncbi:MAG: transporter [Acidobacteriia bacterium]|nr:transporter [Terriglobia bacterium]